MPDHDALHDAIRRPLSLAYHPLYRFYEGGSLTRRFRGLGGSPDDWWSEDWVGSVTEAGNADPDGRPQGLSRVEIEGLGPFTLRSLVERYPEEMLGAPFVERWGVTTGVLVKLLAPSGPVPLHAHPSRAWAERHLGSRFGKQEAWILLETPGNGPSRPMPGSDSSPGQPRTTSGRRSSGRTWPSCGPCSTTRKSSRATSSWRPRVCPISWAHASSSSRSRSRPTSSSSRSGVPRGWTRTARRWVSAGTSLWR